MLTITGIDTKTVIADLPLGPEYGVLYTATPEGRNRYPSRRAVHEIVRELDSIGHSIALHVCGGHARNQLFTYMISDLTHYVDRIQVNGRLETCQLRSLCEDYSDHTIITQHNDKTSGFVHVKNKNHSVLVDSSGGRGIEPETWSPPPTKKPVGFAGGIGPDNITENLNKIMKVARKGWWIDMEAKVRTDDDWLDLEKVQIVIDLFQKETFL